MPKKVTIDNGMVTIPHEYPGFSGLNADQGRALTEDGIVVKQEELTLAQCQQLGIDYIDPEQGHENPTKFDAPAEGDEEGEHPLRQNGPTLVEFVQAGYAVAGYPPRGYAAKPFTDAEKSEAEAIEAARQAKRENGNAGAVSQPVDGQSADPKSAA